LHPYQLIFGEKSQMTVKRTKTPASPAVHAAAASSKSVLVFASADSELITAADSMKQILSSELASFGCKACGTHVTASADSKPFCITCGSEEVEPTSAPIAEEVKTLTDSDVAAVQCSSCGVTNVVTASAVTAASHIHCSCCSTKLSLTADADELPMNAPPATTDETTDLDTEIEAELDALESEGGGADPLFQSVDEETEGLGLELDAASELEDEDSGIVEDLQADAADGIPEELLDEELETPAEADSLDNVDPVADEDYQIQEPSDGDALMDSLEMADDDAGFSTVYTAGRLVAMKGHVAVASLSKTTAGVNADLLATTGFQRAVALSVRAHGLRKGLRALAFAPIRVPTLSKATVSRQVASVQQKAANEVVGKIATFNDSLALAAAGLSRGKWKGYENPLRAAFEVELTRAGIRNPGRISATVFSKNSIAFSKTLVEVASKLAKMSVESRRELADMLDMTEDTPALDTPIEDPASDFTEEEFLEDTPVSLESRLNTTAALLRPRATQTVASSTVLDQARAVLDGKSPLNFL
jgi:hypothetical protein